MTKNLRFNGNMVENTASANKVRKRIQYWPTYYPMLGLRTTIYKVANLDKAKDWYTHAFGKSPYFDEPFYVGFNIGDYKLGLIPIEGPSTDQSDNVLTYWGVDNIEFKYNRLISLGAKEYEAPHNVGGELVVAAVRVPSGNVVGLIYNPTFTLPECQIKSIKK